MLGRAARIREREVEADRGVGRIKVEELAGWWGNGLDRDWECIFISGFQDSFFLPFFLSFFSLVSSFRFLSFFLVGAVFKCSWWAVCRVLNE